MVIQCHPILPYHPKTPKTIIPCLSHQKIFCFFHHFPLRMQKARLDANEAFKNISLGQKRKASVVEKKRELSPLRGTAKRRLTRLDKCKLEAQNAFGNIALSQIGGSVEMKEDQNSTKIMTKESGTNISETSKKDVTSLKKDSLEKSKKGRRKSTSKGMTNRRSTSRRRSSAVMQRRSSTKGKRLTRVQAAQLEVLQSFGGRNLDDVWKSCKRDISTCAEVTEQIINDEVETKNEHVETKEESQMTANSECQTAVETDVETDSLEDGEMGTGNLTSESEEKVAEISSKPCCESVNESMLVDVPFDKEQHAEHSKSRQTITCEVQVQDHDSCTLVHNQSCDAHIGTKGMSPIPEHSLHQSCSQSSNTQISNTTSVEPRPLTRLERARLEAIQSFRGEAFEKTMKTSSRKMAKYLTPVKHQGTNTEANPTRNTPSQTDNSYYRRHPRPKSSFYTNLRDNSFCDRGALLESSKMVVLTARSLDTPSPDCSPAATPVNP